MCSDLDPGPREGGRSSMRLVGRRRFLEMIGVTGATTFLAACAPGPVAAPTVTATAAASPAPTAAATASPAPTVAAPPSAAAASELTRALTWYRQAAFRVRDAKVVYIDAWGLTGETPPGDVVLVTHAHSDHFSRDDITKVTGPNTTIIAPADVAQQLTGNVRAVKPGDRLDIGGVKIEAVPAYNNVPGRTGHPKERNWVGYVIELGGRTYYHGGDTDNVPELATLKVDVALVPIGGTFTMDVGEAAQLVRTVRPRTAVPMHYGYAAGNATDAERFRAAATGVDVTVLTPLVPFTRP